MSDFFVKDEEEQLQPKQFDPSNKAKTTVSGGSVPPEYMAIQLSSVGKLDAPAEVHVRDYNGKDLMDLSLTADEDILRGLVEVLNNLMWEDTDTRNLTEQELMEIMLNIYANFWSPTIQGYPFPYTDEEWESLDSERQDRIQKGIEKLEVDINIPEQVKTNPLPQDFKEPIVAKGKDHTVGFRLPRVNDYFVAEEYTDEKYRYEEQKYADTSRKVANDRSSEIDPAVMREYREYIRHRNADYIMAKQSQTIVSFDGEELDSLEDKIAVYPKVDLRLWKTFNSYLEDKLQFGVDPNIEMQSPIDGTTVIRRCQFRPVDFIPPIQSSDTGEYTIQFGYE